MDRRKFLKTTGTFIAGATVARSALAHVATDAAAAQGRMVPSSGGFHDCCGGSGSRLTSIVYGVILNGLQAVKDLARTVRNVGPQRPRRTWDL